MKHYVKSESGYETVEFDADKVREIYELNRKTKKLPTSINLPEEVVVKLKLIAQERGLGYQTLMRMLIIEGLAKM